MVQPDVLSMFSTFLHGMDNTPVIDYRTRSVSLELLEKYREYMKESSSDERVLVIMELLAAYEETGCTMNGRARSIIKRITGSSPP